YLKEGENIFIAPSLLPGNFGFGLAITFFWILLLTFLSWLSLNYLLDRQPKPQTDTEKKPVEELMTDDIQEGVLNVVLAANPCYLFQLEEKLEAEKTGYIPVPGLNGLPDDVKVKSTLSLFDCSVPVKLKKDANSYGSKLSRKNKVLLGLEITRTLPPKVLVFNNFLAGLPDGFITLFLEFLETHHKGRTIVYFTNSLMVTTKMGHHLISFTDDDPL
ncbi:MAG: hypothetical protein GY940_36330, partial [bacterium]|nr:hypothetical protein [bacterium]